MIIRQLTDRISQIIAVGLLTVIAACITQQPSPPAPTATSFETPIMASPTPTTAPAPTETSPPSPTAVPPTAMHTPSPTPVIVASPTITHLDMIDENQGWALDEEHVLWTSDGGVTWMDATPPGVTSVGFSARAFFLDAQTGWLLVPHPENFSAGTLFFTSNAGQTWEPVEVPFGFAYMQFLDTQSGWVMASQGVAAGSEVVDIYRTTNGGQTWEKIYNIDPLKEESPGDLPFSGIKSGLTFRDVEHGWVTGSVPVTGYAWLFATQDGGRNWEHQELVLPTGFEDSFLPLDPPHFFNSQDGLLPVVFSGEDLYRGFYLTRDGGATWASPTPIQNGGRYDFISVQDIWVWDGLNLDIRRDGTATWTRVITNVDLRETLMQMDIVSQDVGFAITMDAEGRSQLFKTADGGITWIQLGGE